MTFKTHSLPWRMASRAACLVALSLCALAPAAWAADRACVIEGQITAGGQTTAVKDCMDSTAAVPQGQLQQSCEGLAQMPAQMGGKPGKVTYAAQCPRPASGVCKGLMGQPVDAYYYNLSGQALKDKRASCETGTASIKAGQWSNGQ